MPLIWRSFSVLVKVWLRALPEPLIPTALYDYCIQHADNWEECLKIVDSLPDLNRRTIRFVVQYVRECLLPHVEKTKMDLDNLATVFSPCILFAATSEDVSEMRKRLQMEKLFFKQLVEHLSFSCAIDFENNGKNELVGVMAKYKKKSSILKTSKLKLTMTKKKNPEEIVLQRVDVPMVSPSKPSSGPTSPTRSPPSTPVSEEKCLGTDWELAQENIEREEEDDEDEQEYDWEKQLDELLAEVSIKEMTVQQPQQKEETTVADSKNA